MRKWLPAVLIAGTVVFSLAFYSRLPDPMPIHWNAGGDVDGYGSRAFGTFLMPAVMLFMWGLLLALPKLDPRSANIEKFRGTYDVFVIAVIAVMCVIQFGIVASALGWPVPMGRLAPVSIGALFVILGNLLPRFRSNFFFGIRTPWTLSSETVWARTHRVGGAVMMMMGFLLMIAGLMGTPRWFYLAIGAGVAMMLVVLIYSYVIWRAEQQPR